MWNEDLTDALWLSLAVAASATSFALFLALPIGFILAKWKHPLVGVLETAALLPLLLPPTVVGYVLLVIFGTRGIVGGFLNEVGLPVLFTWRGAVIAATTVALPLAILPIKGAIASVERDYEDIAATLGYGKWGTLWHVHLPLARQGIAAGAMLAFARSLGEFGATLMVCGMIPGRTMTLSLSIYHDYVSGKGTQAFGAVLVLTAAAALAIAVQRRGMKRAEV